MNKTSLTLFFLAAACLIFSVLPWPVGETQITAPEPVVESAAAALPDGAALFVAKGCASCHRHEKYNPETMDIFWGDAPDLSYYEGTPEFLRMWLKNPQSARADAKMPNLNLSETEIEALILFLGSSQPSVSNRQ